MEQIKVISFDVEGTLVTTDFSQSFWHEAIPAHYAQKNGLELAEARKFIAEEYDKIGDQRVEWYSLDFWFSYLNLGSPGSVIQACRDRIAYYPEVTKVLPSLASEYKLIVASGTPLELLHYLLRDTKHYFSHIFSSISRYQQLKTPDFYLQICRELDVHPNQIAHVGDSWQFDFLNAGQIGIHAFWLNRAGNDYRQSLADLTEFKRYLYEQSWG